MSATRRRKRHVEGGAMNVNQMILDLRAERDALTAAMAVLEGLALSLIHI